MDIWKTNYVTFCPRTNRCRHSKLFHIIRSLCCNTRCVFSNPYGYTIMCAVCFWLSYPSILPAVHIYNTGRAAYVKFQESHPPYPPEDWV
uniref:Envelope protein n=1 Tax=Bat Coronavirus PaJX20 TaxID=3018874 RepID=A0AA49EET6_9NIDO|nr:envelope protein [Bat Coronavirus PaJX20]